MLVTPSGIEMSVKPEHRRNAWVPMLAMLLGIATLVMLEMN
jgi:hypothetical protein